MKRLGWTMFLMLAAAACGRADGGGGGPDGGGNEPIVEGLPASQFYAKFTYQTTQTGIEGAAAFPTNADGNDAYVVAAFLMPGNQLELFYAEGQGDVSPTGFSINVQSTTKKRRSGSWSVQGADLVLDAFMRCNGMTLNDNPALRCTLERSIVTAAAQGHGGTFRKMLGAASPDDSTYADYMP